MSKERKNMYISILTLVVIVACLSIAYAALGATISVKFGKVTQKPLTWDIGFQDGTVAGEAFGTSSTGRSCGNAAVTKDSVTISTTTLSKPDDRCVYALVVENFGGIVARLGSITPVTPNGLACDFSVESKMVCGNLTYKLAQDVDGKIALDDSQIVGINQTKTVYLVVSYTGVDVSSVPINQSRAGFVLNFVHA